ncbi:Maf family protein [Marinomonas dokdonensis]|uniref:Maf family protein n=1 Tax=Marinomonas dokdonensis TaxID=328224 RepID=UPI0040554D22
MTPKLVLGSSSSYRKALLERLRIPFDCVNPDIDETPKAEESAEHLVRRLTLEKAQSVYQQLNSEHAHCIITSDQVALINNKILGKPNDHQTAVKQLQSFSGQAVSFLTGLGVYNTQTQQQSYRLNVYKVYFRELTLSEIERYVQLEQPFDCAGSFKCEGLGVTLFDKMAGDDPNSLIGLPLIDLCALLRENKINPLSL